MPSPEQLGDLRRRLMRAYLDIGTLFISVYCLVAGLVLPAAPVVSVASLDLKIKPKTGPIFTAVSPPLSLYLQVVVSLPWQRRWHQMSFACG